MDLIPSHTPLTPPHSEEARLDWLRLLRSRRVGVSTFFRLMNEQGSAEAALAALPGIARAAGLDDYAPCPPELAAAEMTRGARAGARMICWGEPDYPAALAQIPDPPPILWAMGDPSLLNRPAVALVGARNASSLGTRMAKALAGGAGGAGFVLVSGLARGIDAAAHLASLRSGTIAVMAGGVDVVYPAENAVIAQEILETGLRISEQPMGLQPIARHFPRRNRLISGLSRAVVVVEAAARSGSLLTARDALDQGREVMAVPGHPMDGRAAGCNALIRDGATLIRHSADLLEALGPAVSASAPDGEVIEADPPPGERQGALPMPGVEPHRTPEEPSAGGSTSGATRAAKADTPGARARGESGSGEPACPVAGTARHQEPGPTGTAPVEPPGAGASTAQRRSGAPPESPQRGKGGAKATPSAAPAAAPTATPDLKSAAALHRQILDRLGPCPCAEDQLIRDIGLPAAQVARQLTRLELDGRIERRAGGLLALAEGDGAGRKA